LPGTYGETREETKETDTEDRHSTAQRKEGGVRQLDNCVASKLSKTSIQGSREGGREEAWRVSHVSCMMSVAMKNDSELVTTSMKAEKEAKYQKSNPHLMALMK